MTIGYGTEQPQAPSNHAPKHEKETSTGYKEEDEEEKNKKNAVVLPVSASDAWMHTISISQSSSSAAAASSISTEAVVPITVLCRSSADTAVAFLGNIGLLFSQLIFLKKVL